MKKPIDFIKVSSSAVVIPKSYPDGWVLDWHYHDVSQLVYACSGVMVVEAATNRWIVPPQRAVWIPAYIDHKVTMHGQAEMRNMYVRSSLDQLLPEASCVFNVSTLLRELILHLASFTDEKDNSEEAERIFMVIIDQLKKSDEVNFYLPVATDKRLRLICEGLLAQPNDSRTLSEWAEQVHMSSRSLSRLFRQDTGLSFVEYRQQARLFVALECLAKGLPVTKVALDVGFSSLSAFYSLFKKIFGKAPGDFFDNQ